MTDDGMPGVDTGRVVVLAGPSGAGKSRPAARLRTAHGWPVVRLDDFYRDGHDPQLPTALLRGSRLVDWDDPRSWDAAAAIAALRDLTTNGSVEVPVYDIGRSMTVGRTTVTADRAMLVVAEGIFAAEVVEALNSEQLLHSAWCVRHNRWVTFSRRLVRDLVERRKPPMVLLRRGLALCRAEPGLVARMECLGAVCASPVDIEGAIGGEWPNG